MWLAGKLSEQERQDVASAQEGTVTIEGEETAVFSSGERRKVKTVAPGGVFWRPRLGEEVMIVRGGLFGEEAYALGTIDTQAEGLAPGELRLRSAAEAGGEIILRNDGRVEINGLLFINGLPYLGMGG